jgi:phage head maturation protease/Arc/MetJ family transcription regulator
MTVAKPDFSGYATRANRKCTDGRTIKPEAFKEMDKVTVPLVWQHGHNSADNVLGHAILESRDDGVYAYGYFNETTSGKNSKLLVQHGDITALSIYANKLVEKSKQVFHGVICEVSLVLKGANPGAYIDNVSIQHADGSIEDSDDEAVISAGEALEHFDAQDDVDDELLHATVQEIYDTMTDDQKAVLHFMVGTAVENAGTAEHSDKDDNESGDDADDKEGIQHMNVFDQDKAGGKEGEKGHVLTHSDVQTINERAEKLGSMKAAAEEFALSHGITNLEILFPDAKNITNTPEWIKRQTDWVVGVLSSTRKSPFSRIKSTFADLTQDAARAKGYITGSLKKEEWFSVTHRTTGPTTVYKKQKLDRDDIIDITDFDVVSWMKTEMRLMLEEEVARAILIGDGREVDDEDKIKDPMAATDGNGIRSILHEHELFVVESFVNLDDANSSMMEVVDQIIMDRQYWKGTGSPTFYTTENVIAKLLTQRDAFDKRMWPTIDALAAEMRVSSIVAVEVMEDETDLVGIIVNLADYNVGADKGGEVNLFDDFDIDYNQYKYLIETRISGALVKIKSAMLVKKTAQANAKVTPSSPTFVKATGVITIPTQTGVVYKDGSPTGSTLSAGAQTALAVGASKDVYAVPASGYFFENNEHRKWTFTRDA